MIRGQVVRNAADLSGIYPKAYIPNGNYDDTILVSNSGDLIGLPSGGFFVEPLEEGWGSGDEVTLTGVDNEQSFLVVYPDAPTTTESLAT